MNRKVQERAMYNHTEVTIDDGAISEGTLGSVEGMLEVDQFVDFTQEKLMHKFNHYKSMCGSAADRCEDPNFIIF